MAGILTDEMKTFIEANRPSMVATASKDGEPNASPKRSIQVLDDDHLMFVDVSSPKTRQNVMENPRVCVTMVNVPDQKGYQFKGSAEYLSEGALYEKAAAAMAQRMPQLPKPKGVVKVRVENVFTIGG